MSLFDFQIPIVGRLIRLILTPGNDEVDSVPRHRVYLGLRELLKADSAG